MPPSRQSRVWPAERPTLQSMAARCTAKHSGLPPLNEGFARPLHRQAIQQQGADATSTAASSSAWVPPRGDGQQVQGYARGSKRIALEVASNPALRAEANKQLRSQVYAQSSLGPLDAKISFWKELAHAAGYVEAFALNADLIYDVSAALWKAGYRS